MTQAIERSKGKPPVDPRSGQYGRPAYSDAVRRKLLAALRMGLRRNAAAATAGIHRDTLYDWMQNVPGFKEAVEEAEDYAEGRYSRTVNGSLGAVSETVRLRAAEFWLERRRPEGWRDRTSVEVTLPPEVQMARSEAIDDLRSELHALGEELLRRGADRAGSKGSRRDRNRRSS